MSGTRRGKQGGNTSSTESSPARRQRMQDRAKAQSARWAAKAGPVEVRPITPEDIERLTKRQPQPPVDTTQAEQQALARIRARGS